MTQDERLIKWLNQLNRKVNVMFSFFLGMAIVFIFLVFGNMTTIIDAQEDTLNTLNDMRIEMESDPPEQLEASVYPLADEERELVIRVVMAEARGDGYTGMLPVAQTILDRAVLWNMTVTEVVTAPGQYADPYQGRITSEAELAVSDVFDSGIRAFEEPVTHFAQGEPWWAENKACRGSVGRHQFWY